MPRSPGTAAPSRAPGCASASACPSVMNPCVGRTTKPPSTGTTSKAPGSDCAARAFCAARRLRKGSPFGLRMSGDGRCTGSGPMTVTGPIGAAGAGAPPNWRMLCASSAARACMFASTRSKSMAGGCAAGAAASAGWPGSAGCSAVGAPGAAMSCIGSGGSGSPASAFFAAASTAAFTARLIGPTSGSLSARSWSPGRMAGRGVPSAPPIAAPAKASIVPLATTPAIGSTSKPSLASAVLVANFSCPPCSASGTPSAAAPMPTRRAMPGAARVVPRTRRSAAASMPDRPAHAPKPAPSAICPALGPP